MDVRKNKRSIGFTLIELMVVIIIVAVLAAVAIPIYRGRIDQAKWAEGKAIMGNIATAIRAYAASEGQDGNLPKDNDFLALGYVPGDLTGTYFIDADFSFTITQLYPKPIFKVTCTPTTNSLNPPSYTLDQTGRWTP